VKYAARHSLSLADYYGIEESSPGRHEYFDGEVFAMAGGTPAHARIAANVLLALMARLPPGRCFAVGSDLRVALPTGLHTYPDAAVYGGEPTLLPGRTDTVTDPRVVVEVLSPSTRAYDLGDKREHYAATPSVTDIVLVESDRREVIHWSRVGDGWERVVVRVGSVQLRGEGLTLPVDELYAGVL